jgi:hypothetical protein
MALQMTQKRLHVRRQLIDQEAMWQIRLTNTITCDHMRCKRITSTRDIMLTRPRPFLLRRGVRLPFPLRRAGLTET